MNEHDRSEKSRARGRRQGLLVCGLVIACALVFAVTYLFCGRNGNSVLLVPEKALESPEVVWFMQKDPRWAKDHLGTAKDTMESSGCLVSALAAGLDMEASERGMDFSMTAGELNQRFSEAQVYNENGAIVWDRIPEAIPGAKCHLAAKATAREIDELLESGIYPAVKVRIGGLGAYHWVLLVGSDGEDYLCMDPLSEEETLVPLSEFWSRIHGVRAVYFE